MKLARLTMLTLWIAAASTLACGADELQPRGAKPRNLLIIAIDTLRADALGTYGAAPSPSPQIDAFARYSVVFENATSHAPWTLPSFASLFTSLYSSTHQCWNFDSRLSEGFTTLAEIFGNAGFATAGIGSHVFFDERYGLQQGFESFDDELAHKRGEEGWVPVTSHLVSEKATAWLDTRADSDQPWLLWVHYFDPHAPFVWHEGPDDPNQPPIRDRYTSEVRFTDHYVGNLFAKLGVPKDTVILLVSDHGEAFGEHPGVMLHGKSLHREELHIPLILFVPGLGPARIPVPVRSVDVLPTLLELFDIEHAEHMEGRSLVPLLRGESLAAAPDLAELRLYPDHHADALTEGHWKLIADANSEQRRLYDASRDLAEGRDLAARAPSEVAALEARLAALISEARTRRKDATDPVDLSPDELEHLRALGYVDESNTRPSDQARDPGLPRD